MPTLIQPSYFSRDAILSDIKRDFPFMRIVEWEEVGARHRLLCLHELRSVYGHHIATLNRPRRLAIEVETVSEIKFRFEHWGWMSRTYKRTWQADVVGVEFLHDRAIYGLWDGRRFAAWGNILEEVST